VTIYGNYAVVWSDTDHVGIDRQHQLQVPLQRIRTGVKVNAHRATSLDESVTNTIVFGSAKLLTAQVKAETNRQSLTDMVEAGLQGKTLTLVDLAQTDRTVDVYMEDPASLWVAMYDAQGTPWNYELEARFRRTDGSAFPDWIVHQAYGTEGVLLKWVPGMSLADATFTRATTATYVDIDGTTQTDGAAANVARDAHYQTVNGVWTRTLRLESAASEILYFDWPHSTQNMTAYVRCVIQANNDANDRLLTFGTTSGAGDQLWQIVLYQTNDRLGVNLNDGANAWKDIQTLVTAGTPGDLAEVTAQFNFTAGTCTVYARVNSGAIGSAGPTAFDTTGDFDDTKLRVGHWGAAGSEPCDADFEAIVVAAGVKTMAQMRAFV
jgi:hypothetical protein